MDRELNITPQPPEGQAEPATGDPFALAPKPKPEVFPTPWRSRVGQMFDNGPFMYLVDADGRDIFNFCSLRTGKEVAERIFRAVNAYGPLLAAAKLAIIEASQLDSETFLSQAALDALNQAVGEEWTEKELDMLELLQAQTPNFDEEEGRRDAAIRAEEDAIARDPEEP